MMNPQEQALNFLREHPIPFQWLLLVASAAMGTCTPQEHQAAIGLAELFSKSLNSKLPEL